MKTRITLLFILVPYFLGAQNIRQDFPWYDPGRSFRERSTLLVEAMTLEEKVSQTMNTAPGISRLGVPAYDWWSEALHGVARSGKATVFPQCIGLAATFDDDLMFRIGTAISDEARAINNEMLRENMPFIQYMGLTYWSPNVNIFRDPRWGRGQETYGEDPFLSGSMGSAFIRGMQGDHDKYIKAATCAKHYVVHSGPEGERHGFNAIATPKDLYETYLPAFKMCVDAGVEGIMCAYNRTNDLPCCGSEPLLIDILREDWGFDGYLVSDCGAVGDILTGHHYVESRAEAAALAYKNKVTLNCGRTYEYLLEAIQNDLINEKLLDRQLEDLLMTRFELGMFDPPEMVPYSDLATEVINSEKHRALALEAAHKSIVLLKNENNVLPLDKNAGFIYISGPLADRNLALLGNYNGLSPEMITVLEGIVEQVSPVTRLQYRSGTMLHTENANPIDWFSGQARSADATIAVVGLSVLLEGEEGEAVANHEHGDNLDLKLPENQLTLLRKLSNDDKPLIVVICAGSPVDLSEIIELADAVLYAWYPGEQGGRAVGEVLFGDVSPSGKLPITFPRSVDQLPPFEDYSMKNRTYKYMAEAPLFPFGYGMSYTQFELGELVLKDAWEQDGYVEVSASIQNTGNKAGEEVLQCYVSLKETGTVVPLSELKGFKRVFLEPGASKMVHFRIDKQDCTYITEQGSELWHQGRVEVYVGNVSPGKRSMELGASIRKVSFTAD